jgi:regulator of ribonuclease activity A
MNIQTADLCDQFEARHSRLSPMFRSYGGRKAFGGEIAT